MAQAASSSVPAAELAAMCLMASWSHSTYKAKFAHPSMDAGEWLIITDARTRLESSGWMEGPTSEDLKISGHGYFGVVYYRFDPANQPEGSKRTISLVFAHRGTCLEEKENLLADIAIAERRHPDILTSAENYYRALLLYTQFWREVNGGHQVLIKSFVHTGFSLGGFIAAALPGQLARNAAFDATSVVTFDAPGVGMHTFPEGKLMADLLQNKVTNYVLRPNIVNTAQQHIGEVRHLTAAKLNELKKSGAERTAGVVTYAVDLLSPDFTECQKAIDVWFDRPVGGPSDCAADLIYTHRTHKIVAIVQTTLSDNTPNAFQGLESQRVASWPVATNVFTWGTDLAGVDGTPSLIVGLFSTFAAAMGPNILSAADNAAWTALSRYSSEIWEATSHIP